jgi:hypothetical protein
MLAILGMALIRTVNLGSDAPKGLPAEQDYGIYVDEGYKTLSVRKHGCLWNDPLASGG